ncbi:MAG: hypothetical protein AAGG11_00985 [Pseudomonadota bacterium]
MPGAAVAAELSEVTARILADKQAGQPDWQKQPLRRDDGRRLLSILMEHCGPDSEMVVWGDANASLVLEAVLDMCPGTRFLFVYSDPEQELAAGLTLSSAPADWAAVVRTWTVRTRAMLRCYLRNRADCLLVNGERVIDDATTLDQLLAQRWTSELTLDVLAGTPPALDHLAVVLSRLYLAGNEEVLELYEQIRAVADLLAAPDETRSAEPGRPDESLLAALLEYVELRRSEQAQRADEGLVEKLTVAVCELEDELSQRATSERRAEQAAAAEEPYRHIDPALRLVTHVRSLEGTG